MTEVQRPAAREGLLELPRYLRPRGVHPPLDYPDYKSTALRHPQQPLVTLPHNLTEITAPVYGEGAVTEADADLTTRHEGEPIGERIIVHGRLLDGDGRSVPNALVEVWQANAAGRYRHVVDQWEAPLDPNFDGAGRVLTDAEGRWRFTTIKPGPYPWGNHYNAWRPAHIHFSIFGRAFTQRLVTQMYFPGDPLFPFDPIYNAAPASTRERMISRYDHDSSMPDWALAYAFDIVLRGRDATPFEDADHDE